MPIVPAPKRDLTKEHSLPALLQWSIALLEEIRDLLKANVPQPPAAK